MMITGQYRDPYGNHTIYGRVNDLGIAQNPLIEPESVTTPTTIY